MIVILLHKLYCDLNIIDFFKFGAKCGYKTYIIDTPGIRSLFPSDLGNSRNIIQKHDLAFCFPEIKFLLPCKFNNCIHIHEPGCKIIAALKNGKIAASRYENYKKILELI